MSVSSVAIQGYAGAFHEVASRLYFKDQAISIVPAHTFEELVEKTAKENTIDAALMAIENTLAGSIMYNYGLLHHADLHITGEIYLRIKQNLMALPDVQLSDLEEVHSHPMAIAQCRAFFKNYPNIRLIETADTALSAKKIRDHNSRNIGAIASTLAADLYDLNIIAPSIETNKQNYTRFLVLNKTNNILNGKEKNAKVSLCFSVSHQSGSLHKVLGVMAAYDANLTKIQSTPIIGKQWEYLFFIDFIAAGAYSYQQILDAILPLTQSFKLLGVYRAGAHFE